MIRFVKRKIPIGFLITLTALSLLGLITTQVFWIGNAIKLAEQQFDNRVSIAMQGALDEYVQLYDNNDNNKKTGCLGACSLTDSLFINLVPELIDSLLKVHFAYHGLDTVFEYSVVKCKSGEVLYAKNGLIPDRQKNSFHRISLSCLQHQDSHHLEVVFGSQHHYVLVEILLWLIASAVFLIVVSLIFTYIVVTIIKQK
ncbi:MAG: hypothetical protein J7L96_03165, partial [Bacteroidales bacterium]|nr:hypothetical protein [Bacteroidales bacterium]